VSKEATMQGKTGKILMGLIALTMAIAFFIPPIIKLKNVALTIVILIGVAAMVYSFIESVREKEDN
jgi:hypothetical protein